jgi:prepilin-type N-terminal cleavage/methylation domain-containing protein
MSAKNKLKAFTVIEMIVVMALIGLVINFAFFTLSYIQKTTSIYKQQSKFISDLIELKKRLLFEENYAKTIEEVGDNTYVIKRDSVIRQLKLKDAYILFESTDQIDTLKLEIENIRKQNQLIVGKTKQVLLLTDLKFNIIYKKIKYPIHFQKQYDASVRLNMKGI